MHLAFHETPWLTNSSSDLNGPKLPPESRYLIRLVIDENEPVAVQTKSVEHLREVTGVFPELRILKYFEK